MLILCFGSTPKVNGLVRSSRLILPPSFVEIHLVVLRNPADKQNTHTHTQNKLANKQDETNTEN